jgi:hypothetical protein
MADVRNLKIGPWEMITRIANILLTDINGGQSANYAFMVQETDHVPFPATGVQTALIDRINGFEKIADETKKISQ